VKETIQNEGLVATSYEASEIAEVGRGYSASFRETANGAVTQASSSYANEFELPLGASSPGKEAAVERPLKQPAWREKYDGLLRQLDKPTEGKADDVVKGFRDVL